ncbi:MAG: 2-amino-4-hydroxy-6-hydroxymethyldihydropteridine diphosphokinase [Chitinophagia bacterium]|nr:2-amino-4-hydroxy-6-hydroxymethyldihydropteridine diphosphokinase [Chitinophagia bacterium]
MNTRLTGDSQTAYLLIGGNIGDRYANLAKAREWIGLRCGRLSRDSLIYETSAWGFEDQPDFLNQVLELETTLPPRSLLQAILGVEAEMGRSRDLRYGPRTIDIDILLYGDLAVDEPDLRIPHPRLADRRFALEPLAELAADLRHPCTGQSIRSMLASCADRLSVRRASPPVDNKE